MSNILIWQISRLSSSYLKHSVVEVDDNVSVTSQSLQLIGMNIEAVLNLQYPILSYHYPQVDNRYAGFMSPTKNCIYY